MGRLAGDTYNVILLWPAGHPDRMTDRNYKSISQLAEGSHDA